MVNSGLQGRVKQSSRSLDLKTKLIQGSLSIDLLKAIMLGAR